MYKNDMYQVTLLTKIYFNKLKIIFIPEEGKKSYNERTTYQTNHLTNILEMVFHNPF